MSDLCPYWPEGVVDSLFAKQKMRPRFPDLESSTYIFQVTRMNAEKQGFAGEASLQKHVTILPITSYLLGEILQPGAPSHTFLPNNLVVTGKLNID